MSAAKFDFVQVDDWVGSDGGDDPITIFNLCMNEDRDLFAVQAREDFDLDRFYSDRGLEYLLTFTVDSLDDVDFSEGIPEEFYIP